MGMHIHGRPLGLAPQALALLGEHTWPGNDAELAAVLLRAAVVASGDTVTRADLVTIGFAPTAPMSERPPASAIPMTRRRRPGR